MKLEQAHELGFDETERDGDGYLRIRCSCCSALVINGVPCHERGCRNEMHECAECCTLVPKHQRLCESCANPGYDDDDDGQEVL